MAHFIQNLLDATTTLLRSLGLWKEGIGWHTNRLTLRSPIHLEHLYIALIQFSLGQGIMPILHALSHLARPLATACLLAGPAHIVLGCSFGIGLEQDRLHFGLFLSLDSLCVCPHLPFFNVGEAIRKLHVIDTRTNMSQLLEDGHHHELDESCLTSCYLCCVSVTQHRHFEAQGLFCVALVKEFFEK